MNTPESHVDICRFGGELHISCNYSTSSDIKKGFISKINSSVPSKVVISSTKGCKANEFSLVNTNFKCICTAERKYSNFISIEPFEVKQRSSGNSINLSDKQYQSSRNSKIKFSKDDWESFFSSNIQDYSNKRFISSIQDGLPSSLRPYIWIRIAKVGKLKLNYFENIYERLISINNSTFVSSINKDIERTFFAEELSSESKMGLFNILKAYSEFDRNIGYCQGINFLALQILTVLKEEENSFWVLIYLMNDRGWRNLFLPGTPKLIKLMKQFEITIKTNLPKLHEHLKKVGMVFDELCGLFQSYFTTIFSFQVLNSFSLRVWDLFFHKEGYAIIEILINLLYLNETHILGLSYEVST